MDNEEDETKARYCIFWDGSFYHNGEYRASNHFMMFESTLKDKYIAFENSLIETQDYDPHK